VMLLLLLAAMEIVAPFVVVSATPAAG